MRLKSLMEESILACSIFKSLIYWFNLGYTRLWRANHPLFLTVTFGNLLLWVMKIVKNWIQELQFLYVCLAKNVLVNIGKFSSAKELWYIYIFNLGLGRPTWPCPEFDWTLFFWPWAQKIWVGSIRPKFRLGQIIISKN